MAVGDRDEGAEGQPRVRRGQAGPRRVVPGRLAGLCRGSRTRLDERAVIHRPRRRQPSLGERRFDDRPLQGGGGHDLAVDDTSFERRPREPCCALRNTSQLPRRQRARVVGPHGIRDRREGSVHDRLHRVEPNRHAVVKGGAGWRDDAIVSVGLDPHGRKERLGRRRVGRYVVDLPRHNGSHGDLRRSDTDREGGSLLGRGIRLPKRTRVRSLHHPDPHTCGGDRRLEPVRRHTRRWTHDDGHAVRERCARRRLNLQPDRQRNALIGQQVLDAGRSRVHLLRVPVDHQRHVFGPCARHDQHRGRHADGNDAPPSGRGGA